MGVFGIRLGRTRIKDPVRGTAQVVSCSSHLTHAVYASCFMELVVQGEGVPATAVAWEGLVRTKKWPSAGITLPVTIDRSDPQRVKIEWDEVPSGEDSARESAQALAAAMRSEAERGAAAGQPAPAGAIAPHTGSGDEADGRLARLEKLGALRDQGVLTDREFEEQKRGILDD